LHLCLNISTTAHIFALTLPSACVD
jgi:hypothetical protein